jgi:hypothetical protein
VTLNYLYVLYIVVAVGASDLVEQVEALLQAFVELNMVDSPTHLLHFGRKLVLLY